MQGIDIISLYPSLSPSSSSLEKCYTSREASWGCAESNCELPESAGSSAGRYDRIAQLNAFIKEYGAANAITVVDYHAALVQGDDKHGYIRTLRDTTK
jgi:hypothetical protein